MNVPRAGDTFRQFRVLERVGGGGMGEVYRARDMKLDRDVALKFLTRLGRVTPQDCDRLRVEAKSLAALNHPNIVTIYDIDEVDGVPFLILEWVPGKDLSDPLHTRPMGAKEFLEIALPIAEALAAAHRRGIIHRDIKPANVLVTDDRRVKLVDFGLAKLARSDQDMTRTGTVWGTVAYMSPEQSSGGQVDSASDIFSFGVLAYELLTGQRPFKGEDPLVVVHAIVNQRHRPLSDIRSDLPNDLVLLVERCLEKEPEARLHNGGELAERLHRLGESHSWAPAEKTPAHAESWGKISFTREQEIRFCATQDGVRIAYSVVGAGPPLVRVLGWFTHLEMEWDWPDFRFFWEQLAERQTVIRYDGRGIGLSDRYANEFTEETRQLDLEAVRNAVGAEKVALMGISEGGWTAAAYAVRHPERVSHLILYGTYARGASARPGYDLEEDKALLTLMRKGWGRETPEFRQVFTSLFFPGDCKPELIAYFNELQRASADPETAARYVESCHRRGDGTTEIGARRQVFPPS